MNMLKLVNMMKGFAGWINNKRKSTPIHSTQGGVIDTIRTKMKEHHQMMAG
jgi:hypothetical protein